MSADFQIAVGIICCAFTYITTLLVVAFVLGAEGLSKYLESSKDLLITAASSTKDLLTIAAFSIKVAISELLASLRDFAIAFLAALLSSMGSILAESVQIIAAILVSIMEVIFSWKLVVVILLSVTAEILLGWMYIREEMKIMAHDVFEGSKQVATPLMAAVQAVWKILSDPWKIIGYALFVVIVQNSPLMLEEVLKAALKSQKISAP